MNKLFFILPVFMLLMAVSSPAETLLLNREQAVALALEKNEAYRSALLEEERVRGQYMEARAGAFPQLTLDGSYLRNIDLSTSVLTMTDQNGEVNKMTLQFGTPHNYTWGFTLYQPLYAAGKVGAAIKIAKYGFKYTSEAIRAARHDVATTTDKAYLDAIAAREAQLAYGEAERLADSNLSVVKKLYEQGQASEFDLLRAQVQAANSRPNRIAADNSFRLALDNLKNILALPSETDIVIDSSIFEVTVPELNLDTLIEEALRERPELRQSEQSVKINQKLVDIAKGGYKPTLGISSSVEWSSFADKFSKSTTSSDSWYRSWNVALTLNWPIFSGFGTVGKVRQAKVDFNQSQLRNSQLIRQVRLEVQDQLGKVREAKQRVEALGEAVTQARRGVEIAQVRYSSGVGTQLELLDAQVALTTARVNKISALHDLAVAVSALRRAVGREWATQW